MSITPELIRSRLLSNPLAGSLSESELQLIIDHSEVLDFHQGDDIVREGEPGDGVYFVLSGELQVSKLFAGVRKQLNILSQGQGFGEISLVSEQPRTATVTASTATVCLKLDRITFDQLLAKNAGFGQKMMKELSKRLLNSENTVSNQLLQSYEALIFSLSDLAESRDPETGAHLHRVQNYCRLLATRMAASEQFKGQINEQFINDIYVTSPLHDIGKVGIPDGVLLKPGRLTAQEFEIMKSHTTIGAKTLQMVLSKVESSTFRVAHNVILHHHERYDGSGYPAGLTGNEISLEGRIMALADVYDALLSKRVYKEALGHEETTTIIEKGAGKHFDPDMTRLFLNYIDEFHAIYQRFKDEPLIPEWL